MGLRMDVASKEVMRDEIVDVMKKMKKGRGRWRVESEDLWDGDGNRRSFYSPGRPNWVQNPLASFQSGNRCRGGSSHVDNGSPELRWFT